MRLLNVLALLVEGLTWNVAVLTLKLDGDFWITLYNSFETDLFVQVQLG
jgi:hypothetical protein